eukprot:scaffold138493_cov18-Tisochrysis_lutea.AAC.1
MIAPAMNLTCYRPLANNGCKSASNSGGVEGIAAFATFYLFWTDKLHVTGVSEVCIGAGDVGGTEEGTEGMEDVAAIFLCLIWNERSHKPLDGPKVCICAGGDARGTEDMATSAAFCGDTGGTEGMAALESLLLRAGTRQSEDSYKTLMLVRPSLRVQEQCACLLAYVTQRHTVIGSQPQGTDADDTLCLRPDA